MLRWFSPSIWSGEANRFSKLTSPVDSPDSKSDIGRILSHEKRPVPLWCIFERSAGMAEPVRMNWPKPSLWSTVKRIVSHNCGAICHSSINRGVLPVKRRLGLIPANRIFCSMISESSIYKVLLACCSAVVVLPHHFGPSIRTAPLLSSLSDKILNVYPQLFLKNLAEK